MTTWGEYGTTSGKFNYPCALAFSPGGEVVVVDSQNNRIQRFFRINDTLYSPIAVWSSFGSGNGQFSIPKGLAYDAAGNLYVVDSGNHRIQKFDAMCGFITKWGTTGTGAGQFEWPEAIAIDAAGNIFVVDANRVQKFTAMN